MPEPAPAGLERIAAGAARAAAELIFAGRAFAESKPTAGSSAGAARLLRERLGAATPLAGLPAADGAGTPATAALQWVFAPHGGGEAPLAVSVAAAFDGEVIAGAVVDVTRRECFTAHRGGGARRDRLPIAASACGVLGDAVVTTGARPALGSRAAGSDAALRVLASVRDTGRGGCVALELCWVACGRLDGCVHHGATAALCAAGALIAEEAGAVVELACPENDDRVLAAAPAVFDALRAVVEGPRDGGR